MTRNGQSAFTAKSSDVVLPSGPIAALDVGSTTITCMIAEASRPAQGQDYRQALHIVGLGQTAARGMRGGNVASVEDAERAIRVAVDGAERNARKAINAVYVNISGGRAASQSTSANVQTQTGVVSPRDLESCVSLALAKCDIGKRHVLHVNAVSYALDGIESDRPPLGMHGQVLGVTVGVVTVDAAQLRNLSMAVERAHLRVAGFALAPYAAGRGVLLGEEMADGSLVIDLGGATTSYAFFRNGNLAAAGQVQVGGDHITADLAQGLNTTLAHAERLKNMFGSVLPFAHEDREAVAVPLLGERGLDAIQQVPKHVLNSIIMPRLEEIFELLRADIEAQHGGIAVRRVVLTGGASQLEGVRDYAAAQFGCLTRIGIPMVGGGISEPARHGGLAVCAGLLALALKPDRKITMPTAARDHIERQQLGYAQRVGRWLKDAL
jgi:cell division protein FtsA